MRTRDSEVVASIVGGDPDGLAAAYAAVQDTFVIAASRLAGLRDPELLRAWLYAVARNECLRTLRSSRPASSPAAAPDVADTLVDLGEGAERTELRALLAAAAAGL